MKQLFYILSMVFLLALTACGRTYTLTCEGDISPLNDVPNACRPGEAVTITLPQTAGAGVHCYLNGEALEYANDGGSPVFTFAMPAENSTITIEITDEPLSTAPAATRPTSLEHGCTCVTLQIPENWKSEALSPSDESVLSGICFRPLKPAETTAGIEPLPETETGAAVSCPSASLQFCAYPFGVCGTGLREENAILSDGTEVFIGYYDGSPDWSFVSFRATDEILAAVNHGLSGQDAQQALDIILSLTYAAE